MSTPILESTNAGAENPRSSSPQQNRLILWSWCISVAWHGLLFALMLVSAWLADASSGQEDLPLAQTDLLGEFSETRLNIADKTGEVLSPDPTKNQHAKIEPKQFEMLGASVKAARPDLSIIGIGTGGGADLGMYGLRASDGGPGPSFFGLGGRARGARRIVYVVDRSGSMITTFFGVKKELRASVERLKRSQKFHVIFFNEGAPLESKPRRLVPANGKQKNTFYAFLDQVAPQGNTDPSPAMERAFAVKPDLIYFLTDGEFDPKLLDELRKWNADKRVRIFTIAYVNQMTRAILEKIALENNGEFRFVSEYDL